MSAQTLRNIVAGVLIVAAFIATLLHFAIREAHELRRDPGVMMNRYYLLKKTNPEAARRTLDIILRDNPHYAPAREALAAATRPPETSATEPLILTSLITPITSIDTLHQPLVERPSLLVQALKTKYWSEKAAKDSSSADTLSLLRHVAPLDPQVLLEAGYDALADNKKQDALVLFETAFQQEPAPGLALQIAYLYMDTGKPEAALPFFLIAATQGEGEGRDAALRGVDYVAALNAQNAAAASQPGAEQAPLSPEQVKMDEFYALLKHDKKAAWVLIQEIVKAFPKNVAALKSAGYLAAEFKHTRAAIRYFTSAYDLTYDPAIALQLGYLYDVINVKPTAYQYFQWATASTDNTVVYRAQNAMTNLRGLQTKALPDPWFGEIFFTPFSQSQFGLTVRPLVARLGVEHNNQFQTKTYLVFRQTDDNKTNSFGQLPQIFEDNVRVIGTGVQVTPIAGIPLIAFVEGGAAYDLIFRFRPRWRPDLRAGIMYYREFGAQPAWYEHFRVGVDYYSTAYLDITYFSRYQNNVIATLKTHQGVRLLQYKSSMLNLYWEGRVIEDTQRQFFNNIGETGPGIGYIPSNRFNFEIRAEHLRGVYFPVGASFNPYPPYYTRNVVQMLFYARV
ncbi:hypothetical protein E3226_006250 [Legionella geestiana]|uniref:tetratricopeptide repeat protein n=1 Tax=Legionella geestiana TaxID=45065 RepID=UPI001092C732|nr:hypothetical protein [Legionella geestiana]QDQ40028.1 hypothetical protein E3226_006250 [Legionella geestiana]